jgi:hypothetical protein
MSMGPLTGVLTSAAGVPFAQVKGSDLDRAANENTVQQRAKDSQLKTEAAAGIGATDGQDHETEERDADGRRPWEVGYQGPAPRQPTTSAEPPMSRDASGECGNALDLSA